MSTSRNDRRQIANNSHYHYSKILEKRNKKFIKQYLTKQLKYPTTEQIQQLF